MAGPLSADPVVIHVTESELSHTWLFSDPHFDHENITRYCDRPFRSVSEMNNVILDNWRRCIADDDLVFFLGDMCFGRGARSARWWLSQLSGRKVYIKGSHDKGIRPTSVLGDGVVSIGLSAIIVTDTLSVLVVHEPSPLFIPYWWRGWVVHGHVHNNKPYIYKRRFLAGGRVNVSADVIEFAPVALRKVLDDIERFRGA